MRRLLAIATVLFALSAGIAHSSVPGFGTEDTCACGSGTGTILAVISPGWCLWYYHGDPNLRYGPC
jgi:hypothetical protein